MVTLQQQEGTLKFRKIREFINDNTVFQRCCQARLMPKSNAKNFCTNHSNSETPNKQWRMSATARSCQHPSLGAVFNLDISLISMCTTAKAVYLGARHTA